MTLSPSQVQDLIDEIQAGEMWRVDDRSPIPTTRLCLSLAEQADAERIRAAITGRSIHFAIRALKKLVASFDSPLFVSNLYCAIETLEEWLFLSPE